MTLGLLMAVNLFGMVSFAAEGEVEHPSLYILRDETHVPDLKEFIEELKKEGIRVTVSPLLSYQFAGSDDLSHYTALLYLSGQYCGNWSDWCGSPERPDAMSILKRGQDVILDFVKRGGHYIAMGWGTTRDWGLENMQNLVLFESRFAVTPTQQSDFTIQVSSQRWLVRRDIRSSETCRTS